jgi:hypothetical protein
LRSLKKGDRPFVATTKVGHGSAVSLPRLIVGKRQCRVLISGYINSDATGFDISHGSDVLNIILL